MSSQIGSRDSSLAPQGVPGAGAGGAGEGGRRRIVGRHIETAHAQFHV